MQNRTNNRLALTGLAIAAITLAAGTASAGTLYFAEDGTSTLYTLSTTDGSATAIGASGSATPTVGLAPSASPTQLWGSQFAGTNLVETDGSAANPVGTAAAEALGYDAATDTLYGAINSTFFTINTVTGDVDTALANPTGLDFEGFAFGNGVLYAIPGFADNDTNLWQYDPGSATWSIIGDTGIDWTESALAFDPVSNTLYATHLNDTNLYSIDPSDGSTSVIGNTGIVVGGGLAWVVPAPGSVGLLGLAGIAALRRRRA